MLIEENKIQRWLDNFYGYGSWNARIWFIDHEESGGDVPTEEAAKFNYFSNAVPPHENAALCDMREMYKNVGLRLDGPRADLFNTYHDYRFGNHAVQHGVWKNLIAFAHGYENNPLPDLLEYQKSLFASPAIQREALIALYPLPTHNHAWYYSWLDLRGLPFLKNRSTYHEYMYTSRIHRILQNISVYKPEVVLMYDMKNINALKNSVQEIFPAAKFKMVKAITRKIPQHHRADFNGTTLLITSQIPALRHNRIESGFDWHALAKTIKS